MYKWIDTFITFVQHYVYYSTNNNLYYNIDLKKTSKYLMIREHRQIWTIAFTYLFYVYFKVC